MRVRTLLPHHDATQAIHQPGEVYELTGLELELRLKDAIVAPADAAAPAPAPVVETKAAE